MPLVFVHGVNVRKGELYERELAFRNYNFAQVLYKQLGRSLDADAIFNPYWGDLGASLSTDYPFLPRGSYEMLWKRRAFGPTVEQDDHASSVELDFQSVDSPLLCIARNASLDDAIDLLWSFVEHDESDPSLSLAVAKLAERILTYSNTDEGRAWLAGVKSDDELVERLLSFLSVELPNSVSKVQESDRPSIAMAPAAVGTAAVKAGHMASLANSLKKARESLAEKIVLSNSRLKEGLQDLRLRARKTAVGTTAKVFNEPLRTIFHKQSALLIGDAFSYFSSRGDNTKAAPIAERVIESMREAHRLKEKTGDPVVVVGHSMGGVILCDIVTCYAKEIPIDVLITVGSQYPLFADLQMFPGINGLPRPISRPENVKRWFNIFDPHDFLGYPASHIFDGVEDFHLPTYSLGAASHTDYFNRPSFYFQLARRLSDYLPVK